MTPSNSQPQGFAFATLHRALSLKRPHGGAGVQALIQYLAAHLPDVRVDGFGNLHIDTRSEARHRTLFVAHLDTVHHKDGANHYKNDGKTLTANDDVLGADDGVGIAILAHLIQSAVPAYFVFTQGEECGGLGAKHLARQHSELLSNFDRAIAFDRRGTSDVITHQAGRRCSSDAFAEGLSNVLNAAGMLYMPSSEGIYTDTAEFMDVIPECTNLSCGYFREHSKDERLDLAHFKSLLTAVTLVDWDALPTSRNPLDFEDGFSDVGFGLYGSLGGGLWTKDPDKSALMEAVDIAWSTGYDYALKKMLAATVPAVRASLVLAQLKDLEIPEEALDFVYDHIDEFDVPEILAIVLELTDTTLC